MAGPQRRLLDQLQSTCATRTTACAPRPPAGSAPVRWSGSRHLRQWRCEGGLSAWRPPSGDYWCHARQLAALRFLAEGVRPAVAVDAGTDRSASAAASGAVRSSARGAGIARQRSRARALLYGKSVRIPSATVATGCRRARSSSSAMARARTVWSCAGIAGAALKTQLRRAHGLWQADALMAAAACRCRRWTTVPASRYVLGLVLGLSAGHAVGRSAQRHRAAPPPLRPDLPACIRARSAIRRHHARGHAAHAAPRLRHAPAAGRHRYTHCAEAAGPQRREHDDGLHACARAGGRRGAQPARCLAAGLRRRALPPRAMSSPALAGPPGPLRDAAPAALPGRWADRVWAGTQFAAAAQPAVPTGYAALDAQLPGGGWPAAGLTELLFDAPGSGEWRLLAPALRAQAALRPLVCVAPPLRPYAPALQALGLPLQRVVWVTPPETAHAAADAAWALEQALRSGGCGAALWWGDAGVPVLRRLHLAALEHGCLLWLLRPLAARAVVAGAAAPACRPRRAAARHRCLQAPLTRRRRRRCCACRPSPASRQNSCPTMLWLAPHPPWLPLEAVAWRAGAAVLRDAPACRARPRGAGWPTRRRRPPITPGMSIVGAGAAAGAAALARDPAREQQLLQLAALAGALHAAHRAERPAAAAGGAGLAAPVRRPAGAAADACRSIDALGLQPRLGIAPRPRGGAAGPVCRAGRGPGCDAGPGAAPARRAAAAAAAPALAGLLHGIGCRTLGDARCRARPAGRARRGPAGAAGPRLRRRARPAGLVRAAAPVRADAGTAAARRRDGAAGRRRAAPGAGAGRLAGPPVAGRHGLQPVAAARNPRPPGRGADAAAHRTGPALARRGAADAAAARTPVALHAAGTGVRAAAAAGRGGGAGRPRPCPSAATAAARAGTTPRTTRTSRWRCWIAERALGEQHVQCWAPHATTGPKGRARARRASRGAGGGHGRCRAPPGCCPSRCAWPSSAACRCTAARCGWAAAERIEAGWFDGAPACRDYHVALGADHRLRWVFHERRGEQSCGWFLHGFFA